MMRRLALVLVALGGLIVVASLALLNYMDLGDGPQKLWDISHRSFLIFTILAVLAGIFGLIAIFRDAWLLPILAAGAGFFLLGEFLPTSGGYSVYKAGLWGALAGSVIMAVAGVIALVGLRRELVPDGLGAGTAASPGTAMRELATDSPPATRDPVPVAVGALVPAVLTPVPGSNRGAGESPTAILNPAIRADTRAGGPRATRRVPTPSRNGRRLDGIPTRAARPGSDTGRAANGLESYVSERLRRN